MSPKWRWPETVWCKLGALARPIVVTRSGLAPATDHPRWARTISINRAVGASRGPSP